MPRLGSFSGARGFGRFGLRAFLAMGGTDTVDANGFRHHIFKSSGNLEILSGGEKEIFIIAQDGGNSGLSGVALRQAANAYDSNFTLVASGTGGTGGASGQTRYLTGTLNSNLTITVGAAGNASSITGINLSTWKSATQATGGTGSEMRVVPDPPYPYRWANYSTATAAASGVNYASAISSIYSSINTTLMPATSGGGGGGGGGDGLNFYGPSGGGITGGGGGGRGSSAGASAGGVNTGGGGGGGAHWVGNIRHSGFATVYDGALGGSGYVVVSYAL